MDGVRLFDVQMMGGIVLHEGDIAEMRTGEGKTFVATMPLYLNSLTGQNVHLVTVNDYLARRDPEWVKPAYDALGVRTGFIHNMMPFSERKDAYAADITSERTPSSASTTSATTWPSRSRGRSARPPLRDRGRGRLDPHRRGAHPADHLRRARDRGEGLLRLRPHREGSTGEPGKRKGEEKASTRRRAREPTTPSTRSSRPSHRAQRAIDKIERALKIEKLYDPATDSS